MKPCIATFIQLLLRKGLDEETVFSAAEDVNCTAMGSVTDDEYRILIACPDYSFFLGYANREDDEEHWLTISFANIEALEAFLLGKDLSEKEITLRSRLGEDWLAPIGAAVVSLRTTVMEPGHA